METRTVFKVGDRVRLPFNQIGNIVVINRNIFNYFPYKVKIIKPNLLFGLLVDFKESDLRFYLSVQEERIINTIKRQMSKMNQIIEKLQTPVKDLERQGASPDEFDKLEREFEDMYGDLMNDLHLVQREIRDLYKPYMSPIEKVNQSKQSEDSVKKIEGYPTIIDSK